MRADGRNGSKEAAGKDEVDGGEGTGSLRGQGSLALTVFSVVASS